MSMLHFMLRMCCLTLLLSASVANATLGEAQALELGSAPYYATEPYAYFLEDAAHSLTIDEVTQPQQLSRFQTLANKGGDANWAYSSATIWLAIPVATAEHAISDWLVEVGFATLDNVEIYVPRQAGGFDMQTAGDLQPFAERPFTHRNLVFPIHIAPNSHETIFLKITSRGSMTIPVKFWQHDALHYQDQISYSTLSIYFGSLLALGIYSLLIYLSVREKIFLVYVAFVTSMAVSQASLCGFGNQFVWSNWISWGDIAFPAGTAAAGFFGTLFSRLYLTTQERFPKIDRLFLWMAAVFAFAAVSVLFVPYRYSAILTGSSGFVFAALATWSGFYCMRHGHKGARLFLIAWMMLLIGVALQALRNFDLIVTNNMTLHGMQIGSALEMLLLAFALADRFNLMREEKELAQDEALMAKQLMVDTLRQSEHELEQKVLDRTHAMNAANQLLRENESSCNTWPCMTH